MQVKSKGRSMVWMLTAALGLAFSVTKGVTPSWALEDVGESEEEKREPSPQEAGNAQEERLRELERQVQILSEELEKMRLGEVAGETTPQGRYGFAPAASKVYGLERGVSLGGYGESAFQDFSSARDDGDASGALNQFDFIRAIVYLGYKWSDRILFNSEIEFEHASTGEGGEVSVEFAYVDFFVRPEVNLRGGMVLIPMGFLNELHEPPVFHGALRPQVERIIIPSTWRENGGGAFGDVGPFAYRTYVVAGLSAEGFSSSSALRGGRQKGSRSIAEDLAWTGRIDWVSVPGLVIGGSFFTGDTGQGLDTRGRSIEGRVDLFDLHAQLNYRGLELRGLYARGTLDDADLINEARGLSGEASLGSVFRGGYVEAAYDVLTLGASAPSWSLTPFIRYEDYDTQAEVPAGFRRNPANDGSLLTTGVDIKPHPSVVIKVDYQDFRNDADSGVDQWNIALGYLF